jgi:tetratricopeptide (TPR) repeat protein
MAVVLANSAEDNAGYERAIEEYKAASMAAPWWGDAYKKLAAAQKAAGRFDDAIASMNLYMLTQPTDARNAQDEIYQLMALKQTAAAENEVKKQREQRQLKLLEAQQEKERAVTEGRNYTVEGRWYQIPLPSGFFVGGNSKPECDYIINQNGGRWAITNSCSRSLWAIDNIQVQARLISFRLSGHDPGYPLSVVNVTFTLSADGKTLEGQESVFNKGNEPMGAHAVRWIRREE